MAVRIVHACFGKSEIGNAIAAISAVTTVVLIIVASPRCSTVILRVLIIIAAVHAGTRDLVPRCL